MPPTFRHQHQSIFSHGHSVFVGAARRGPHIDDALVFRVNRKEHEKKLSEVLDWFRRAWLTLNKEKCKFGVSSSKFLGVAVLSDRMSPDPDKVEALLRVEPRVDLGGVGRLIGLINHVARFLPHLSDMLALIGESYASRRPARGDHSSSLP